jgi:hypothetical protein
MKKHIETTTTCICTNNFNKLFVNLETMDVHVSQTAVSTDSIIKTNIALNEIS